MKMEVGALRASVIVCTYNRARTLKDALASLLCQEGLETADFEVVVVDDGSTDETRDTVASIAGSTAVAITCVCGSHSGLGAARNLGVTHARGAWVAFFDDDEVADPRWLAELLAAAERTGADGVAGRIEPVLVEPSGFELTHTVRLLLGEKTETTECRAGALFGARARRTIPGTGNALVRKGLFAEAGWFNGELNCGEDAEFFRRARRAGAHFVYADAARIAHMIPPSRLQSVYLTTVARNGASCEAVEDLKDGGAVTLARNCAARVVHLGAIILPRLLFAVLRRDRGRTLGARCSVAFCARYCAESLRLGTLQLLLHRRADGH